MPQKILIVEDETVVLNFARNALKKSGHEVMTAQSVAEAQKIVDRESASDLCLVIDVVLEKDSGIAFAEELIEKHPGYKVLLMSGFTDAVLMTRPEHEARITFLRKPFTKQDLLSAIDSMCASRS